MVEEMGLKAVTRIIELGDGSARRMDFDMGALANAETAYEDGFGKSVNINVILAELAQGRTRAIMAMAYGAMLSAGERITWKQFGKDVFTFENYTALTNTVADAVVAMMGATPSDPQEETPKNAHSRGAS